MTAEEKDWGTLDFKSFVKSTLRGFVTLALPSGPLIHGCTIHPKNNSVWIGLPLREYVKDSSKAGSPVMEFTDSEARQRFQRAALAAERHLDNSGGQ